MAVHPYTAPQGDEKRVFHHPAKAKVQEAGGTLPERFNSNIRLSLDEQGIENPFFSALPG